MFIGEPTVEDTISILRGLKEKYELHHGVRITDAALVAAATLSNRYITDRFLPDKAIDLMDEAAEPHPHGGRDPSPRRSRTLDRRIIQLKIEREALKKEKDAASKDRLKTLEGELANLEQQSAELTQRWQAEKDKIAGEAQDQGAARRRAARARAGAARRRSRQGGRAPIRPHPRSSRSSSTRPQARQRAARCCARR